MNGAVPEPESPSPRIVAASLAVLALAAAWVVWAFQPGAFLADDLSLVHAGRHMMTEDFWRPFHGSWVWHDIAPSWRFVNYLRPIVILTFGLDWLLFGFHAAGFYLTTALLHILSTALVFALALHLIPTRRTGAALAAALLFALHPAHEYDALWLSARGDVLATLFTLLALLALLRLLVKPTWGWSIVHIAATLAALLSKENAFALPLLAAVIVLYQRWPDLRARQWKRIVAPLVPAFTCATLLVLARLLLFHGHPMTPRSPASLLEPLFTAFRFARSLALPAQWPLRDLITDHPLLTTAATLAVLLVGTTLLWRAPRKRLLLWGLLTAIAAAPNMVVFFPWYAYLPSVGFCLLLGDLLVNGAPRHHATPVAAALVTILATAYAATWIHRGPHWKTAGNFSHTFVEDYARLASQTPDTPVILLTAPGGLNAIPIFYHNLPARLDLHQGHFDRNPDIAVFVEGIGPLPQAFALNLTPLGPQRWRVETTAEGAFLALPQRYRAEADKPAPLVKVIQVDPRGLPTAAEVDLAPVSIERPTRLLAYDDTGLRTTPDGLNPR